MEDADFARGFRDVDATADSAAFVGYLDAAQQSLSESRTRSFTALDLEPGDAVLDAGCGTGDALLALAAIVGDGGRVAGVDHSAALVAEARQRTSSRSNIDVVQGDVQSLPFDDESFTGCRTERLLLHVGDPGRALRELARVTRPGGRVVATEPDWDTLIIDSDDLAMARRVARSAADAIAHPDIGRRLGTLAVRAGLDLVDLDFGVVTFGDARLASDLMGLRMAAEELGDPAAVAWWERVEGRAEGEPFVAAMAIAVMTAQRPG